MDNPQPRKQFKIKGFTWLWYLKEIGWALIIWLIISQSHDLLPHKLNVAIAAFAIMLLSFWVRSAAASDISTLAQIFNRRTLLRHAIIVSILAMIIGWVLAVYIINVIGWVYL